MINIKLILKEKRKYRNERMIIMRMNIGKKRLDMSKPILCICLVLLIFVTTTITAFASSYAIDYRIPANEIYGAIFLLADRNKMSLNTRPELGEYGVRLSVLNNNGVVEIKKAFFPYHTTRDPVVININNEDIGDYYSAYLYAGAAYTKGKLHVKTYN